MVLRPLVDLMEASANNRGMTLCLALSYGGRDEIVDAWSDEVDAFEQERQPYLLY